ncbi:MAG: hypothetical protein DRP47_07800 [Candidatus Zixiibacteriota bacterium]|nr:MAG: hypothetical protein DRP47_07800 [candidate division Zixibacteria bacterium]
MKTTLALLIAGLIFLATPMLASANGNHHNNKQNQYKDWVKSDRGDHRSLYNRYGDRHNHRYEQKCKHHAKNHLRQELRETRHELHQVRRQARHNYRHPYYVSSAVLIGLPHVVFELLW